MLGMTRNTFVDPNSIQVGGDWYKADFQHWDFVTIALGGFYLEGCLTKYATRWRSKNGLQDLHKSQHYVTKLIDVQMRNPIRMWFRRMWHVLRHGKQELIALANDFADSNALSDVERDICIIAATWTRPEDLFLLLTKVAELIIPAEKKFQQLINEPVACGIEGDSAFAMVGSDVVHGEVHWINMDTVKKRWPEASDKDVAAIAMAEARTFLELRVGPRSFGEYV
jgi:hypothetical protein